MLTALTACYETHKKLTNEIKDQNKRINDKLDELRLVFLLFMFIFLLKITMVKLINNHSFCCFYVISNIVNKI